MADHGLLLDDLEVLIKKNMNMKKQILITSLLVATLAGCAHSNTTFKEYVGGREMNGTGGAREVVNGMEVWTDGTPNRRFRVIGIVDDERNGGVITRRGRIPAIIEKAKEAGGDAVVIYSEGSEVAGMVNNSFGSASATAYRSGNMVNGYSTGQGTSVAVPIRRLTTKAAVIKYANSDQ